MRGWPTRRLVNVLDTGEVMALPLVGRLRAGAGRHTQGYLVNTAPMLIEAADAIELLAGALGGLLAIVTADAVDVLQLTVAIADARSALARLEKPTKREAKSKLEPICAGCGFAHADDYKDCVWNKNPY